MEKKPRKQKKDYDFNVTAFRIVQDATKEPEPEQPEPEGKNPNAVALGKARASKLTPEQRKEIARVAANARWKKG